MWQAFALASVLANACENVVDKAAIVLDRRINYAIATFWRNALFLIFTTIVGVSGWLGTMHFYFGEPLLLFCALSILSSFLYTYLLKRIEVTGIAVDTYLMPIVFLFIDVTAVHAHLSFDQIIGIVLLTAGGFAFSLDARTHRFKREWSPIVWAIFAYWILYDGVEFYLFKYLNVTDGLNSVSFNASVGLVTVLFILLYVICIGRSRLLFGADAKKYVPAATISKLFDTVSTLFWMQALTFAAVSQVSAIGAIEPIALFLIASLVQGTTRFSVRERLDRSNVSWKLGAVGLLSVGMFIIGG